MNQWDVVGLVLDWLVRALIDFDFGVSAKCKVGCICLVAAIGLLDVDRDVDFLESLLL